jgi:hypothetical protein
MLSAGAGPIFKNGLLSGLKKSNTMTPERMKKPPEDGES